MNPKRPTPRNNITKMSNIKEQRENLKNNKKKAIGYIKESPHRLSADFQKKLCRAEGIGTILKVMKSKEVLQGLLHSAMLSFKNGEIKEFLRQEKTKGVHGH